MNIDDSSMTIAKPYAASQDRTGNTIVPSAEVLQSKTENKISVSTRGTSKNQSKDQVSLDSSAAVSATVMDTLKSLDHLQAKSNELAQNLSMVNKNISKVTDLVSQMQSSLASITKNFPPFNIESKDRQQILMSYISIRQEMLKMTIPPPPPPLYENTSDIWKNVIGSDNSVVPDAAPALQTDSSDREVAQAEKSLINTRQDLNGISSAISKFRPGP